MSDVPISDIIAGIQKAARSACTYFGADPDGRVVTEGFLVEPMNFARWQLVAHCLISSFEDNLPKESRAAFSADAMKSVASQAETCH